MHELSIATEIVDQVLGIAHQNRALKIESVELEAGRLKGLVPDLMVIAFDQAAKGTMAEGAQLKIHEIKPLVRCRQCQGVYEPEIDNFICTQCQKAYGEVIQGDTIILKSVVLDQQGETRVK